MRWHTPFQTFGLVVSEILKAAPVVKHPEREREREKETERERVEITQENRDDAPFPSGAFGNGT